MQINLNEYFDSMIPIVHTALKNETLTVITGCTKLKIWDLKNAENLSKTLPAGIVYKGPLFKQFINFKQICENKNWNLKWKIFSAKYGLIYPETLINEYNVSFVSKYNTMTNQYVRDLEVYASIHSLFINEEKFKNTNVVLIWAGKEYVTRLVNSILKFTNEFKQFENVKIFAPASGLKIGESLHVMKEFNTRMNLLD